MTTSNTNSNSRLIIVDPVTGCVEASAQVSGSAGMNALRRKAGAQMKRKGLQVEKIRSGNGYAG
jgi:porphobilinogen deaminase